MWLFSFLLAPLRVASATLAAALALTFAITALAQEAPPFTAYDLAGTEDQAPVIVGVIRDFPPYYMVDEHDVPRGYAIDVMNDIAQLAGIHVIYRTFDDWTELNAALKSRTVTVVPNMGITDVRQEYLDFTDPYEQFYISVFAWRDKVRKLGGDISVQAPIAVAETNAAGDILRRKGYSNIQTFKTSQQVVDALVDHKVDFIALPEVVMHVHMRDLSKETDIVTVGNRLIEISRSIAVVKGHKNLHMALNAAIADYVMSPEYDKTYQKWFAEDVRVWTLNNLIAVGLFLLATALGLVWLLFHVVFQISKLSPSAKLTATYRSHVRVRQRMMLLTGIMLLTVAVSLFYGMHLHYQASLKQIEEALIEDLTREVGQIEDIYLTNYKPNDVISTDVRALIIAGIRATLSLRSGEKSYVLATRENDRMHFILRQHRFHQHSPAFVPISSTITDPMHAALSGKSGTMIGRDIDGDEVLAAYDYFPSLELGIVLKRDMGDIQASYFKAGFVASFVAFLAAMTGMLVYIRITASALRELHSESALIEGIMNNAQALILVRDHASKLIYANKAYCDLFGSSLEDLLEHPEKHQIEAPDKARFIDQDLQVIRLKLPIDIEETVTVNGEERIYVTKKFPIFSETGDVEAVGGISIDASDRHAAEQQLKQSEARFRAAFEKSAVGLTMLNEQGRYINVNARMCKITGYSRDELLSMSVLDITISEDIEREKALLKSMLQGAETSATREKRYIHKDGSIVYVRVSSSIVVGENGTFEYFINVVEDINAQVQAQRNIALQRDRFRQYLDVSGTLIVVLDVQGTILTINRFALDLLQYEEEELLGQNWFDIAIPEDRRESMREIAGKVASKDLSVAGNYENEIVTRTGERRLISWSNTYLENEYGNTQSLLSSGIDITEIRQNQNNLLKANAALRAISRCNEVLVHASNEEQLLSEICRTIVEEAEFSLAWVTLFDADKVSRVMPVSIFGYGQDAIPVLADDVVAMMIRNAGVAVVINDLAHDERVAYSDADVEKYGLRSLCALPLHDKGEAFGALFIGAPIRDAFNKREIDLLHELSDDLSYGILSLQTELDRQTAQIEREKSERRAEVLIQNAYDAIISADAQGCIVQFNPAAETLFNISSKEAIGQNLKDVLIPERFHEAHQQGFDRFVRAKNHSNFGTRFELIAKRTDGVEFPIELALSAMSSDDGEVCSAVIRDISDRKEAERQRRQAQNMESLGNMAGGIAHDINNMLLPIMTLTGMVKRTLEPDSPNAVKLNKVLQAADHMSELIKGILKFSRQSDPKFENVCIQDVINEALDLIEQTTLKTVTISKTIEDFPELVYMDAGQITSALINLVSNSSYAMAGHTGHVEIRLEKVRMSKAMLLMNADIKNGYFARISVIDDGEGIPDAVLSRVIDPFFTTKAPGEGTGLGLAMVHGIVTAHGGALDITSKVGEGTRVDLYLPLKIDESVKESLNA